MSLADLAAVQDPVAVLAMLAAIVYYNLIDRRLMRRRGRAGDAADAAAEKDAQAEKGGDAR